MTIKHIFTDLDGTLLNSDDRLTDENAQLIKQSRLPVTMVSARSPREMLAPLRQLALTGPQIAFNGDLIYQIQQGELKVLDTHPMNLVTGRQILSYMSIYFPSISTTYYDERAWYADHEDYGTEIESQVTGEAPVIMNAGQFLANPASHLMKIMIMTHNSAEREVINQSLTQLHLQDVNIKASGEQYLEITSRQALKSIGINYIAKSLKLNKAEMVAFGDGQNDFPMFQQVGLAVAMENAATEVKAQANLITKTNDLNGVGWGLNYLIS